MGENPTRPGGRVRPGEGDGREEGFAYGLATRLGALVCCLAAVGAIGTGVFHMNGVSPPAPSPSTHSPPCAGDTTLMRLHRHVIIMQEATPIRLSGWGRGALGALALFG